MEISRKYIAEWMKYVRQGYKPEPPLTPFQKLIKRIFLRKRY